MDPTDGDHHSLARPVPRAWLDPHVVDTSRLDRLLADSALAQRLHEADYAGSDWEYFASELIKYGYAVLVAWMRDGLIWRRLAAKGLRGFADPPRQEWNPEAWNDLAGETLVIAVEKFRDTVLATGRWDPQRGASLKTFFIGQCLIRFPNVYRSWHTATTALQAELRDDLAGWRETQPTVPGPEQTVLRRDEITRGLAGLDARTRAVLLLLERGYDQTEVAEQLGTSRKAVEMIVRRHRARRAAG